MDPVLTSGGGVTLVGGGTVEPAHLAMARALAPLIVAADGGADRALALGLEPAAVIGDMDSLSDAARARLAGRLHLIPEQNSTDMEKCLSRIAAPFVIGVGFGGPRMDHALAALSVLVRRVGPPAVLLAGDDAVLACPPAIAADLPPGTRLSLFPMGAATARGSGLRWPPDGIGFAPAGRVGTSNQVTGRLALRTAGPMLLILPAAQLAAAVASAVEGARA